MWEEGYLTGEVQRQRGRDGIGRCTHIDDESHTCPLMMDHQQIVCGGESNACSWHRMNLLWDNCIPVTLAGEMSGELPLACTRPSVLTKQMLPRRHVAAPMAKHCSQQCWCAYGRSRGMTVIVNALTAACFHQRINPELPAVEGALVTTDKAPYLPRSQAQAFCCWQVASRTRLHVHETHLSE